MNYLTKNQTLQIFIVMLLYQVYISISTCKHTIQHQMIVHLKIEPLGHEFSFVSNEKSQIQLPICKDPFWF